MLKNIVFDLAGVVVARNPQRFPKHLDEFFNFVFKSHMQGIPQFWTDYDLGILEEEKVAEALAEFRGCDLATAKGNMQLAIEYQEQIEPTAQLIKELKERGYKLYVLSNMSKEYIEFLREFPVFDYFDEQVVSCEIGLGKPDRRIYEYLLEKYELNPAETIFIDDRKDNVDVAEELGITPFHFDRHNPEQACTDLRKVIYNE
jgi:epoxide hydrolase-like predicted phosphatase